MKKILLGAGALAVLAYIGHKQGWFSPKVDKKIGAAEDAIATKVKTIIGEVKVKEAEKPVVKETVIVALPAKEIVPATAANIVDANSINSGFVRTGW